MKRSLAVLGFLICFNHLYAQFPSDSSKSHTEERPVLDSFSMNNLPSGYFLMRTYTRQEKKELRKWRWRKFWSICNITAGTFHTTVGIALIASSYPEDKKIGVPVAIAGAGLATWGVLSVLKSTRKIKAIKQKVVLDASPVGASIKYRF